MEASCQENFQVKFQLMVLADKSKNTTDTFYVCNHESNKLGIKDSHRKKRYRILQPNQWIETGKINFKFYKLLS